MDDGENDGLTPIERFHWQRVLQRADVPEGAKKVGLTAATFGNEDGSNVRPGTRIIADIYDLRERVVSDYLGVLRRVGLLRRVSPGGGGRAAVYQLTIPGPGHAPLPMRLDPNWRRLTPRRDTGNRGGKREPAQSTAHVESAQPVDNSEPAQSTAGDIGQAQSTAPDHTQSTAHVEGGQSGQAQSFARTGAVDCYPPDQYQENPCRDISSTGTSVTARETATNGGMSAVVDLEAYGAARDRLAAAGVDAQGALIERALHADPGLSGSALVIAAAALTPETRTA